MRIRILDVPIDALSRKAALKRITAAVAAAQRPYFVVTPNPEFLVLAQRDGHFASVLQAADLAVADGHGLLWAAERSGKRLPERVTGTDLMQDVCAWAAAEGRNVYLLGGAVGVAEAAAVRLKNRFPALIIAGADDGGRLTINEHGQWRIRPASWDRLTKARPDILFFAFGHGRQEKWIAAHLERMPWLKMAMGVGGAFDFIAGRVNRAPDMFRRHGLEWLWRLITQPWRWRRIADAIVVFPLLVIRGRRQPSVRRRKSAKD